MSDSQLQDGIESKFQNTNRPPDDIKMETKVDQESQMDKEGFMESLRNDENGQTNNGGK